MLVLLISVWGCGDGHPARSKVTGSVSYNGEPLHIGSLVFIPVGGGPPAQGNIDRDGNYFMGTFDESDGVIPGKYKVMITAMTSEGGSGLRKTPSTVMPVPCLSFQNGTVISKTPVLWSKSNQTNPTPSISADR